MNYFRSLFSRENFEVHPLNWTQGIINYIGVQRCEHEGPLHQHLRPR